MENITSGKLLKNTYHSANLKVFIPRSPTSSPPSSPTSASDCTPDSPLVDITTSPRKRKASLESLQPDKRPETVRNFEPIPAPVRRNFATSFGLVQCKPVYFGRSGPLTEPKRTKQTKGDGNCYFQSISYILSGTEDHHLAIRDQVVNHMTNNISQKLEDYMNQAVLSYLKKTPMQDNGVWATDAEIMATASLLGIDIIQIMPGLEGDLEEWQTQEVNVTQGPRHYLFCYSRQFYIIMHILIFTISIQTHTFLWVIIRLAL